MFVKNILFTLIFLPCIGFSQLMYEVDYAYQADILLYEVDYAYQADIKYWVTNYQYQADKLVFRVQNPWETY